jgi:hypothetical protein
VTDERREWHLEKGVNVSHIIATLTLAVSAFAWANSIDKQVAITREQVNYLQKSQAEAQANMVYFKTEIKQDLRDISSKLEKIAR